MGWQVVLDNAGILAVHAALLPNGQVLYFGGSEHNADQNPGEVDNTRLWSVGAAAPTTIGSPTTDAFCSGHAQLPDGRILVGGGTEAWVGDVDFHDHNLGFPGERACWVYAPRAGTWTRVADMGPQPGEEAANTGGGRWYPTLLTLANGQVLAMFGHPGSTDTRHRNNHSERYSSGANHWFQMPNIPDAVAIGYTTRFLNYPRLHLLPNGQVFFGTPLNGHRFFDPFAGTLSGTAITPPAGDIYQDWYCQSVLLPLLPSSDPTHAYRPYVLQSGGSAAHRIDLGAATPAWSEAGGREAPVATSERWNGCAVLLPTGDVFVCGGTGGSWNDVDAVKHGEIYKPGINWATGKYELPHDWQTAGEATVARNYHSVALLLPNGWVWTAGSNFDGSNGDPASVAEFRIEVFKPDYDAAPTRPQLNDAPLSVTYGEQFTIATSDTSVIERVALIRCGTVTHAGDFDQRYVGLTFSPDGANALTVQAPPNSAIAPPGNYMLWIVDHNDIPCPEARIVRVTTQTCLIITDRSTFSSLEVETMVDEPGEEALFERAFYVVFDGFLPSEIGTPLPFVTVTPRFDNAAGPVVPDFFIDPLAAEAEDPTLPPDVAQRFTWPFHVRFTSMDAFSSFTETRQIHLSATLGTRSCNATLTLMKQPNPYMLDGNPHWLSTDICVFRVSADSSRWGIPQAAGTGAGYTFINAALTHFRGQPDNAAHPFQQLLSEQDTPATELDLATHDAGGKEVFNYAIARVRYRAATTIAPDVRVFFRTFNTVGTALEYRTTPPDAPYRRTTTANPVPLLGTMADELVSIPYFAQARTSDMAAQIDTANVRPLEATGAESWEFYGCWLDFNRAEPLLDEHPTTTGPFPGGTPIMDLMRGRHHCLVAEIHFTPDPIPELATPGSSENLAQRNLAIAHSDNPGNPASHTIQHTFLVKPSKVNAVSIGYPVYGQPQGFGQVQLAKEPINFGCDELMIQWNDLPRDSRVTMFFSDVTTEQILAMAGSRHGPPMLEKVDEHTIALKVGGITYVPIPGPRGTPIPALLTIELPDTVVYGQRFDLSVHQCSGINRRIMGAFQVKIPISHAENILQDEERNLSVLRRIGQSIEPGNHWYPVFQRYLGGLADKVRGLGGDPDSIAPNRDGSGRPEKAPPREVCPQKWAYAAVLAAVLVAAAVFPLAGAPFIAAGVIVTVALACWWWVRCRPRTCEVLTLSLLGVAVAAAVLGVIAFAAAPLRLTFVLALCGIVLAVLAVILTLTGCCGCKEEGRSLPRRVFREMGLHILRAQIPQPKKTLTGRRNKLQPAHDRGRKHD